MCSPCSALQMSVLCRHLDQLWGENQGCVVLFTWVQFLKEEALDFLGITSPLVVLRVGSKAAASAAAVAPAERSMSEAAGRRDDVIIRGMCFFRADAFVLTLRCTAMLSSAVWRQ